MEDPSTATWDLAISSADFTKLKAGFEAIDMNQRWEIIAKEADASGVISIHISRSWTQEDQYILTVEPSEDGGAKITSITWEQNKGDIRVDEERGKEEAVVLCRMALKCEFETLPAYDMSILWAP